MTGPAGSWCTTSALPQITMTIARRIGSAVSGSYVEFSSSTRRRLQIDALSWRVGGWVSTLCRHDAGPEAGNPAPPPELRWPRRLLPCAINPPRLVHYDSPPTARLLQVWVVSNRRVKPVNRRSRPARLGLPARRCTTMEAMDQV